MRRFVLLGFCLACGSSDSEDVTIPCDSMGACPTGLLCEPTTQRCVRGQVARPDGAMPDGPVLDTVILDAPAALSSAAEVTFTFDGVDAASFECSLDAAPFAPCASPLSLTVGAGAHVFEVRAAFGGLSDPTPARHAWTCDLTAPDTTITQAPSGTVNSGTADITFTASEPDARFDCRGDAGAWTACESPWHLVGLGAGTHRVEVAARDAAGNRDPRPAEASWTVVFMGPSVVLEGTPAEGALVGDRAARFTFTSAPGATFGCSLDGAIFAACTSPVALTVGGGAHRFAVRATDPQGHEGPPATRGWTVDAEGPAVTIGGTPKDGAVTADPQGRFVLAFVDPAEAQGGTFECATTGGFEPCTTPVTLTFAGDGVHHFSVRGRDRFGNLGAVVLLTFTLDRVAPAVKIDGTPEEGALVASRAIALRPGFVDATEATRGATLVCQLDQGPINAAACGAGMVGSDGAHRLTAIGRDPAGNEARVTRSWVVDTVAPTAVLAGTPADGTVTGSGATDFSWSFAAPETGGTLECALKGPGVDEPFSPAGCRNRTSLADGVYRFSVRGRDAAGNIGAAVSVGWTVDAQGPVVVWLADSVPAEGAVVGDGAYLYRLGFADPADATGGHFEVSLDGTTWIASNGVVAGSVTVDGLNRVRARGVDASGNVGSAIERTLTLDTIAPRVSVGGTPADGASTTTSTTAFTWTFTSVEPPTSTFECSANGGAWAACANAAYPEGSHTFAVRGRDAAGNVGSAATVGFTVDTQRPTATIAECDPANGSTSRDSSWLLRFSSNELNVGYECLFDGTRLVSPCTNGTTHEVFTGTRTVVVRAIDRAGNVGDWSAAVSYTLDNVGPRISITQKPANHSGLKPFEVRWSTDEPATFQCKFFSMTLPCTVGPSTSGVASGTETGCGAQLFGVTATDALGNVSNGGTTWQACL